MLSGQRLLSSVPAACEEGVGEEGREEGEREGREGGEIKHVQSLMSLECYIQMSTFY